jgi:hypothetical protein
VRDSIPNVSAIFLKRYRELHQTRSFPDILQISKVILYRKRNFKNILEFGFNNISEGLWRIESKEKF